MGKYNRVESIKFSEDVMAEVNITARHIIDYSQDDESIDLLANKIAKILANGTVRHEVDSFMRRKSYCVDVCSIMESYNEKAEKCIGPIEGMIRKFFTTYGIMDSYISEDSRNNTVPFNSGVVCLGYWPNEEGMTIEGCPSLRIMARWSITATQMNSADLTKEDDVMDHYMCSPFRGFATFSVETLCMDGEEVPVKRHTPKDPYDPYPSF